MADRKVTRGGATATTPPPSSATCSPFPVPGSSTSPTTLKVAALPCPRSRSIGSPEDQSTVSSSAPSSAKVLAR